MVTSGYATTPVAELVADPVVMRDVVNVTRAAGRSVGFVPTMGALHAGHLALVDQAAAECDDVIVSIFVNPTQFGPGEDFERYPRNLEDDFEKLRGHRVCTVFTPRVEAMYPSGAATRIVIDGPANGFEGDIRPGHFSGVATIVCRLFLTVPADRAYFGAKDWQQTRVVNRMVRDLGLPIDVVICPTVREPDGLAMSSRNAYLTPDERRRAVALSQSLAEAADSWAAGVTLASIEAAMRKRLEQERITIDYAAIADAESLGPVITGEPAVALIAGRLGSTRLIDNRLLPPREEKPKAESRKPRG